MMRRLCVTNVPLHVRKEEFASVFRPLDGCIECRLVNQDNRCAQLCSFTLPPPACVRARALAMGPGPAAATQRCAKQNAPARLSGPLISFWCPRRPVGFVTFATEQQARNAQEAYNLWQGFGQGGLLIELVSVAEQGGPRGPAMPQQQPLERPPFQGLPAKRQAPEPLGVKLLLI